MRIRDPNSGPPYITNHSELFEAAYDKLEKALPHLGEAYDALDWIMARDPWSNSEAVDFPSDRAFRLAVTPRTVRYPALRVLIEIQDSRRRVYFWHLSQKA